ncbi:MAG: cupredoxin domain-containing protein [Trueperaceae bacterium]
MAALNRTIAFAMVVLLAIVGAVMAQDDNDQEQQDQEQQAETRMVGGEEFVPVGEARVGEPAPFDTENEQVDVEVETGAIVFTGSTPDDQHPNIDLVGPDDYFNHFEIDDEADAERVIDNLLPGVYSVAATDNGLQLVHTLVEVVAGQAVRVDLGLDQAVTDFVPGRFANRGARTAFPADGFRAGDPRTIDNAEFGGVAVETDNEDARFVITGPDAYSREFTGAFDVNDLMPGVYVIAGTADGSQITTSAVEVEVSRATTMVPAFTTVAETDEVDGDVAGGGEAEEGQDQTDGEQPADEEEQPEGEAQEEPVEDTEEPAEPENGEEGAAGDEAEAEQDEIAGGGEAQQTVRVSLVDGAIDMPSEIPAGTVTFEVTNDGTIVHNFEIEGQGVEETFSQDLQPGDSNTMTVDLEAGEYYVYCPVDDHEEQGMAMDLQVTDEQQ